MNISRANLHEATLYGADLYGADLRGADLYGADLHGADLRGANLSGADLYEANLCGADLSRANLRRANLCGANLREANLCGANLYGAILQGADLQGAILRGAVGVMMACPEKGSFIGFKKAGGHIVELEVCEDARRSSATTRKCRCDKARVISITNLDGTPTELSEVASDYDPSFIYAIGKTVETEFDEDRFTECGKGIHFFINRQEAVDY